jgi:hypothetical protein
VSLSPGLITCHLLPAYNATLSLTLDSDCWLKVNSNVSGIFSFQIRIANNVTRLQRKVTLRIIEKIPVRNKVLLSNPQVQYGLLNNATSINLIEMCQAVAVSRGEKLHCSLAEPMANISLDNCHTVLNNCTEDYNLSVIFTQAEARKTCHIQVLNLRNSTSMEEYPIVQALLSKPEYPLWAAADQAIVDTAFFKNLQQCSQLLTIPLLQEIFEGIIDPCHITHTYKTLLKFIPRITLLALGYTSFLSAGMAMLASILTDFMREKLANNISSKLENCIQLLFFIVVTELEYAPSNLWQLSGQLEIFPESIALLNKLIVQMALAPALKTGAYLTSQGLMQYLMSSAEKVDIPKQQSSNADFFSAFNVARNTVFSRKIFRPFTFFARPAANNRLSQIVEDLDVNRPLAIKTA